MRNPVQILSDAVMCKSIKSTTTWETTSHGILSFRKDRLQWFRASSRWKEWSSHRSHRTWIGLNLLLITLYSFIIVRYVQIINIIIRTLNPLKKYHPKKWINIQGKKFVIDHLFFCFFINFWFGLNLLDQTLWCYFWRKPCFPTLLLLCLETSGF